MSTQGGESLMILSCFSSQRPALSLEEIARVLKLPPATVQALTANLVRVGCLQQDTSGAFTLAEENTKTFVVRDER